MLDINAVREKCRNSINNTAVGQFLKQALDELEELRHKACGNATKPVCTCHERDGSFCCDYCHSLGIFGHCERALEKAWHENHV